MATQRSGTLFGFVLGLFTGLALAAVVAFFVMRSSPFGKKDEGSQPAASAQVAQAPASSDPNQPMYRNQDQQQANGQQTEADFRASAPAAQTSQSSAVPTIQKPQTPTDSQKPVTNQPVYLQAGAFKNIDQANNQKGSIAFLGMSAKVQKGSDNLYRVRIGPVPGSSVASTQARLKGVGIATTVIR